MLGAVNTATTHNQALGRHGERIAEQWLTRKGWRVLQRRFRDGHRDIDLIAERDGIVAFVEVKARSGEQFGTPVGAVDWRKQREMVRAARVWITRHGRPGEAYRFDVIGVLITARGTGIHCVENAFGAGM